MGLRLPLRYIPALVIIIGLICCTAYFYLTESAFINDMEITSGKVVELGNRSTSAITVNGKTSQVNTQAIAEFLLDGKTYRVAGRGFGYPRWKVGQAVDIYYSPEDPRQARIHRLDELFIFTFISAFFLIACLLFAGANFIVYKIRGKPLS